jgi:hypothetical protein
MDYSIELPAKAHDDERHIVWKLPLYKTVHNILTQAAHARRQYDAVDPANRLVAGELERRTEVRVRSFRDYYKIAVYRAGEWEARSRSGRRPRSSASFR